MKTDVMSLANKASGSVSLNKEIFGLEPRADILQRMVNYQLAKRQAGTHKTKERGEITGTTKRVGKQKGGGTARHGSRKANIFVGGGVVFGPQPRSHAVKLQKKVRTLALKHALSSKVKGKSLIILEDAAVKDIKTAKLRAQLAKLGAENALIIGGKEVDEKFSRAASNIPLVDVLPVQGINVYDILRRNTLVLTKQAVEELEARLK